MAVPPYEEDTAEEFTGPGFPGYSEYEGDEFYEDDDEDPELNAPISEPSAAQRVGSHEPSQAGILRDYIQIDRLLVAMLALDSPSATQVSQSRCQLNRTGGDLAQWVVDKFEDAASHV